MNMSDLIPPEWALTVAICVEKDEGGKGYFSYTPGLEGLYAEGDTEEDAIEAASDLIPVFLESLRMRNEPIPENEYVTVSKPGKPRTEFVQVECSQKTSGISLRTLHPVTL